MLVRASFIPILLQLCAKTSTDDQFELKRETLYALINICSDARMMDFPIIEVMMQAINQILCKIIQLDRHDVSNEELATICLNFISFVLHVSANIEQQSQSRVKQLIPFPIVKQFQQRYTHCQAYQQAAISILKFVETQ